MNINMAKNICESASQFIFFFQLFFWRGGGGGEGGFALYSFPRMIFRTKLIFLSINNDCYV